MEAAGAVGAAAADLHAALRQDPRAPVPDLALIPVRAHVRTRDRHQDLAPLLAPVHALVLTRALGRALSRTEAGAEAGVSTQSETGNPPNQLQQQALHSNRNRGHISKASRLATAHHLNHPVVVV